jgi:hypothetical protein
MADVFSAPIPGQSLTDTPKNFPWERPAEITDPREAIKFHIDGINRPEALDNIIEMLQIGIPVNALSKTALTTAQMEGIHSVDVSLIIGDVIKEELISIAEEAGIDYVTGDEPSETDIKEKEEQEVLALLRKKIGAADEMDAGVEMMQQTADMMDSEEEPQEEAEPVLMMDQEEQEEETMPQEPRGLMAKG